MALSARTVIFLFMCFSLPPSPCHSTLDTCLFSFDHFIRSRQHVRRNRQADLLGSFQIDDQLKLCWLFHWHFSWLCTSQDFIHVDRETFFACCASAEKPRAKSKAHKATLISFLLSLPSRLMLVYRITLSALASTFGGIVKPICLAAFRLTINSNFVGCSTGRSAGLVPFKILSTNRAASRPSAPELGP